MGGCGGGKGTARYARPIQLVDAFASASEFHNFFPVPRHNICVFLFFVSCFVLPVSSAAVEANVSDTVADLKENLKIKEGIPVDSQVTHQEDAINHVSDVSNPSFVLHAFIWCCGIW